MFYLNCRICREILYLPVKMPCRHMLCLPCYKNLMKISDRFCPFCKARLGSWTRKPLMELIDQALWEVIQAKAKDLVMKRQQDLSQETEIYWESITNERPRSRGGLGQKPNSALPGPEPVPLSHLDVLPVQHTDRILAKPGEVLEEFRRSRDDNIRFDEQLSMNRIKRDTEGRNLIEQRMQLDMITTCHQDKVLAEKLNKEFEREDRRCRKARKLRTRNEYHFRRTC